MAEVWDEQQLIADGFERVHVESEWYDGPRAGVADVGGEPHYFHGTDEEFEVWPASPDALAMEREQWAIFVRWNQRYEAGTAATDSHPGHGGIDARYDELEGLLGPHRQAPAGARRLTAEMRFDNGDRYRADGLDYWFRWR